MEPSGPVADDQDRFVAWLGPHRSVLIALGRSLRDDSQWYAVAENFNVAGTGQTPDAAVENLTGLLDAYLWHYFEGGRAFEDAVRPVPRRLRAWIRLSSTLNRLFRRVWPPRFPREQRIDLPSASHSVAPTLS